MSEILHLYYSLIFNDEYILDFMLLKLLANFFFKEVIIIIIINFN